MEFERAHVASVPPRSEPMANVWTGLFHGRPACWVVVARHEDDLVEWSRAEAVAIEASPLRICCAVLDGDALLIEHADAEAGDPSAGMW
jgi:hypothetical protein